MTPVDEDEMDICPGCDEPVADNDDAVEDTSTHYYVLWHRPCAHRADVELD